MTFVSAFYGYSIEIADTAQGRYEKVRIKVPLHPEEEAEYLQARVLAFAHAYEPGLELSPGLFEPKLPTIQAKDLFGETTRWIHVGLPDREKVQRALKHSKNAEFRIYFTSEAEIERFCHFLRGSTTNWVAQIRFYSFNPEFLHATSELLDSSSKWELTFTDESVYATINGTELETQIIPIDIWSRYQHTIANISD